jgi:hypothetical protein
LTNRHKGSFAIDVLWLCRWQTTLKNDKGLPGEADEITYTLGRQQTRFVARAQALLEQQAGHQICRTVLRLGVSLF